ncbi:unnamed protein product [Trifolium pratense]|uniref:Uncharacterized protein n=1 Tax=Trifolium pratense TaxID=57577 RepID=A0ACB0KFS6_TRIPR|nr:unnamed protein product [Trifolium pratense]
MRITPRAALWRFLVHKIWRKCERSRFQSHVNLPLLSRNLLCNCNSCCRKNGWMPTGNIYNKVVKLGFKSVAHYLIKTRRSEESIEGSGAENVVQEIPETTLDMTQKGPIRTRRALRS